MRLIDADALKELFPDNGEGLWTYNITARMYIDNAPTVELQMGRMTNGIVIPVDNASTVELKQLKEVRNICEHWNDKSSSFVSACNAFEDILHIFKLGVGDTRGDTK